ncbi:hypothetical protein NPS01_05300 [Nocardioides psychrotolerans]|uniref:Uncharacterized protein n=1 Tax=Nocardioides psychrotolerans TaxID=1005945 RepID=A0A1I3CQZ1_9ACTN|nr:hypothetical protein [Nocardioides psychrotolerans]GEP36867.1 hypothetical protein NPS01_05300 [Nocardioides psychrotolerans]SFH76915.1 hypothetical protein SAMN05216561_102180 [Nocardioides psychrotolerans]
MTATLEAPLEPASADEVYVHRLEPRRRGPVRRVLLGALDLWCATQGGLLELTRAGDIVVRRRSDGVEELRVPLVPGEDAALALDQIREQLESQAPDEFRARWGIA